MMRDLEKNKVEEDVDRSEAFLGLKPPYKAALRGDWDTMKSFFNDYPEHVVSPLTINGDTAFHIAAYSESKDLLQHLVHLLPPSGIFDTLSKKNNHVELGGITPLFLATKSGCIEIVKEILEIYPQAIEHIDNEGRTILHVAIKYRQLEVFKLVLKMEEVPMRWLLRRLDNDGNSILHMVGIKIDGYVPEKMRGPALELQEEML